MASVCALILSLVNGQCVCTNSEFSQWQSLFVVFGVDWVVLYAKVGFDFCVCPHLWFIVYLVKPEFVIVWFQVANMPICLSGGDTWLFWIWSVVGLFCFYIRFLQAIAADQCTWIDDDKQLYDNSGSSKVIYGGWFLSNFFLFFSIQCIYFFIFFFTFLFSFSFFSLYFEFSFFIYSFIYLFFNF